MGDTFLIPATFCNASGEKSILGAYESVARALGSDNSKIEDRPAFLREGVTLRYVFGDHLVLLLKDHGLCLGC